MRLEVAIGGERGIVEFLSVQLITLIRKASISAFRGASVFVVMYYRSVLPPTFATAGRA